MPAVSVFGITGRMGQSLASALREAGSTGGSLRLGGALAAPGHARIGGDAATDGVPTGVTVTADPAAALIGAAVAVDFSSPHALREHAEACVQARVPLLVGVTGYSAGVRTHLDAAAALIPVLLAPNTSLGVSVVARLVEAATRYLGAGYDVEISEAHHRDKRDAPSGTALALGAVVAAARGRSLDDVAVYDRHGRGAARGIGDIGFAVVRAGDIVGEHTVLFAAAGESVAITHRVADRRVFAVGALRGANWLIDRPAGLYSMDDVLGEAWP